MRRFFFSNFGKRFKTEISRIPDYLARGEKFLKKIDDGTKAVISKSRRISDVADKVYGSNTRGIISRLEDQVSPFIDGVQKAGALLGGLQAV